MLEQDKVRIDDKSIWELRKMLPEDKLTTLNECFPILEECLDFIAWGVLKDRVIILTASARILLTVQVADPDIIKVEYFPNRVDWEENPHRKTFRIHKIHLKWIKDEVLENSNRKADFSEIVHGQYYD